MAYASAKCWLVDTWPIIVKGATAKTKKIPHESHRQWLQWTLFLYVITPLSLFLPPFHQSAFGRCIHQPPQSLQWVKSSSVTMFEWKRVIRWKHKWHVRLCGDGRPPAETRSYDIQRAQVLKTAKSPLQPLSLIFMLCMFWSLSISWPLEDTHISCMQCN